MNPTRTLTIAALLASPIAFAQPAAAEQATCIVTLQPWNNTVYQAAYTTADGVMHVLEHRQNGAAKQATDYEIPADFDTVLWATKRGVIDGPSSFYDHLRNGGGCSFSTPYGGIPGKQDSVVIRPGTPATTTSTTAPPATTTPPTTSTTVGTTTSTTVTLPPVTVTWRDELPPATFPPTLPEQPPTTLPDGLDLVGLIPSPTPYTAVPTPSTLPVTGGPSADIARTGLLVGFLGGVFCVLAAAYTPLRRRMRQHVANHQQRNFDAS